MDHTATERLLDRMGGQIWLTDGGLETAMIFLEGLELPQFAAFTLLDDAGGRAALERYFAGFLAEARQLGRGFVLGTPTWRASWGWGQVMGIAAEEIDALNRRSVAFAQDLRDRLAPDQPVLIEGMIGPHGDAYRPGRPLSADEAYDYHHRQVAVLADAGADLVTALTLASSAEAIGLAEAARETGVPVSLSFTLETDGRLPGGETLADAIAASEAATGGYAAWYGVNCAHPDHFTPALGGDHAGRIGLLRANASRQSHAELDEATELDDGDPHELATACAALAPGLPGLRVMGGCCGTDLRHVAAMGRHLGR